MNKFILIAILFVSCKDEKEISKVIEYETPKKEIKIDSTEIQISDLPIFIDGTDILLHPIGKVRISNRNSSLYSDNKNYEGYTVSNHSMYEITGELQNILFQDKNSDSLKPLTNEKLMIQTITYLEKINNKNKVLVYTIYDKDTNKDGNIDKNDVKTLHLSSIDGSFFKKITSDFQELIDWKLIEKKNRLYFRTIEDINKNGKFDKDDKIHYYYTELDNFEFISKEYHPFEKK